MTPENNEIKAGNDSVESHSKIEKTMVLGIGQKQVFDNGTLEIEVKDIIYETIAPEPEDIEGAMPGGSGVSVYLSLKKGNESMDLVFEDLSEPYESKKLLSWEGYTLALVSVNDATATILVSK